MSSFYNNQSGFKLVGMTAVFFIIISAVILGSLKYINQVKDRSFSLTESSAGSLQTEKPEKTGGVNQKGSSETAAPPKLRRFKVYHGPGEYMGAAGYIKEGAAIKITGIKQGEWFQIEFKNRKLWMEDKNLKFFNEHIPSYGFVKGKHTEKTVKKYSKSTNKDSSQTQISKESTDKLSEYKTPKYYIDLDVRSKISRKNQEVVLKVDVENQSYETLENVRIEYKIYGSFKIKRSQYSFSTRKEHLKDSIIVIGEGLKRINGPLYNFQIGDNEKEVLLAAPLKHPKYPNVYCPYQGYVIQVYSGSELIAEEHSRGIKQILE